MSRLFALALFLIPLAAMAVDLDPERFPVRSIARSPAGVVGLGDADHVALETCEAAARGAACSLASRAVRVGQTDHIVKFEAREEKPHLDFSRRTFSSDAVPFVWMEARPRLRAYVESSARFRVLALAGSGSWAWSAGSTFEVARLNALASCRTRNSEREKQTPCFVYAENDTVVMKPSDITRD